MPRTVAGSARRGPRHFAHEEWVWGTFPQLQALAATVRLPSGEGALEPLRVAGAEHVRHVAGQDQRPSESSLEPIRAWRAVFAETGVRPTQYRCAAESLLRRLRTQGTLPVLHPLVDLCNGLSVRWVLPIAVLDLARVHGSLRVRRSSGVESHTTFGGATEHPDPGEIAYVDGAGHAHSRRWCWRQSAHSAVQPGTTDVLVVAEAVHQDATGDLTGLGEALVAALGSADIVATPVLLTSETPTLPLPVDGAESTREPTGRDR